jgi:hypothetical protein
MEDAIYREIMKYRRPPENVFTGAPERMEALLFALSAANR